MNPVISPRARDHRVLPVAIAAALLGLALLGYTGSRASRLSFVHDESFTYLHHVDGRSVAEIFAFLPKTSANNHPLNSALMKLAATIAGPTPLALRLPNLLAHLLYLAASWLLVRRLRHPTAWLAGFLLLNLHPYLLDFFGLARGYGLALAFELLALHLLLLLLERTPRTTGVPPAALVVACFLSAALAALANLAHLHLFTALAAVWTLTLLARLRTAGRRAVWRRALAAGLGPPLLITGLLAALLAGPIARLRAGGELYFGGQRGLWSDTILSLIRRLLYGEPVGDAVAPVIGLLMLGLFVVAVVLVVRRLSDDVRDQIPAALLLCLTLCGLSIMMANWLAGVRYIVERTALLLLPLFALAPALLLDQLLSSRSSRVRLVGLGLALILTATLGWHAARSLNLSHTLDWRFDADTARALALLERQPRARRARAGAAPPLSLGTHWLLEPTLAFYRRVGGLSWLAPVRQARLPHAHDCLLLPAARVELGSTRPPARVPRGLARGLHLVRRFSASGAALHCR